MFDFIPQKTESKTKINQFITNFLIYLNMRISFYLLI
jgi:hypothetical protein